MRLALIVVTLLSFFTAAQASANSLTDLLYSGARYIVEESQGHFPEDSVDDLAKNAHVLSKSEVESLLKKPVTDDRLVYVSYPVNDCVVETVVVAIMPGQGVQGIWYFDGDSEL